MPNGKISLLKSKNNDFQPLALLLMLIICLLLLAFTLPYTMQHSAANSYLALQAWDQRQVPRGFPADLPLESNAPVTQNYTISGPTQLQSTREFISSRSLDDNANVYRSYMLNNGWSVYFTNSTATSRAVYATKNGSSLRFTANRELSGLNRVTLEISFNQ